MALLPPPPHEVGHDGDEAEEQHDGGPPHRPLGVLPLRPQQDRPQLFPKLLLEAVAILLHHSRQLSTATLYDVVVLVAMGLSPCHCGPQRRN